MSTYATRTAVDARLSHRAADLLVMRLSVWLCDRVDVARRSVDSPARDLVDASSPLGADADALLLRLLTRPSAPLESKPPRRRRKAKRRASASR